jgi:uncharacterized protein (DUF1778 family)
MAETQETRKDWRRVVLVVLRVSQLEYDAIDKAARAAGLSRAAFLRTVVLRTIQRESAA